jgi:thiosulfate/3-mercaptopyruvate sulfurtransferase
MEMSGKVLVSANELSEMLQKEPTVLIDTRDPGVYAEAHIPEAVNLREVFTYLAMSTPGGVKALQDTFAAAFGKAGLGGGEAAVVYEQSMSTGFGQSCRGYVLLRALGCFMAAMPRGWRQDCPAPQPCPHQLQKHFRLIRRRCGFLSI